MCEVTRVVTLVAVLGEGEDDGDDDDDGERGRGRGTDMANRVVPSAGANTANGGGPKQVMC